MRGVGRNGLDPAGDDHAFAPFRTRAAFVRVAPMDDRGGAVHLALQEALIRFVANRLRHDAVVVGNHAIGGHNGVAFEAVRPDHEANDSGAGGVRHFAVAAAVPAVVPWASSGAQAAWAATRHAQNICIIAAKRVFGIQT